MLTHWGRVTHICVGKLTIIGSDNGLSPGQRQAIIWTDAGILLIGPLGTNFSEILIEILTFSFKKMHLKMSSGKWRPFCLGLNVLSINQNTIIFLQANALEMFHAKCQLFFQPSMCYRQLILCPPLEQMVLHNMREISGCKQIKIGNKSKPFNWLIKFVFMKPNTLQHTVLYNLKTWCPLSLKGWKELTHWGRVTHICVAELGHHWFR